MLYFRKVKYFRKFRLQRNVIMKSHSSKNKFPGSQKQQWKTFQITKIKTGRLHGDKTNHYTLYSLSVFSLAKSLQQEPITQGEKLPCARVTAFSWTSLFLDSNDANLEYLLDSPNQSAKPKDLKMIFFCRLITFSLPFCYLILRMRS